MTYRAITVDPEQIQKVSKEFKITIPEDAYISDDSGNFCITISKDGFGQEGNKSLIFIFSTTSNRIKVIQDYVLIDGGYQLNNFEDIECIAKNTIQLNEDNYHLKVLTSMFDMHMQLSSKTRFNRNKKITTNLLLKTILTYLNKAIVSYYGLKTVNLKNSHFFDFYNVVGKEKLIVL
jgi:hypothetical protein